MKAKLFVLSLLLVATACGKGERPFRMVQFCLADVNEIDAMKATLRRVAIANKLSIHDNSKQTEADLDSIAQSQKTVPVAHPTVNVVTIGSDAMGFSAGNFAEAPLQIVIGFSKGRNSAAAQKLSDTVVQALSHQWQIHEVPNVEEAGAFPLESCG